ncbi:gamma-glutamyl-phosphate reductase [Gammaproteobacteria bacterium SCGC AG-212-F23]|nr:gamma-glutamyl-phosphate reductase [Gammaproteobacteria bacterium SCGC AG-212-F23]
MLSKIGQSARDAARILALASNESRNHALKTIANTLQKHQSIILEANQKDIAQAKQKNISAAFLDRLTLTLERINAMAAGLIAIAALPDPLGKKLAVIQRPNQLEITRISVPIGVIAVIYESRPNVTADAAGLCLKSGNAIILRGGSESFFSSLAIMTAIQEGLLEANLPATAVQMIPTSDREAVTALLKMDKWIDVIIPRGGQKLIDYVTAETHIPVFKHLAGICHTYIHQEADIAMAEKILLNAKMRRTGICGATEVALIDEKIAEKCIPLLVNTLTKAHCEIRGDETAIKIDARIKPANATDFDTEFLEAIIAIKIVKNINEAIQHIAKHGTQHTDAIITEDKEAAEQFLREVDSAIVMHNTSTQFADGGEFGMGAEIGIATGKLHARGPVGVEQLTIFKYLVRGHGQIRD